MCTRYKVLTADMNVWMCLWVSQFIRPTRNGLILRRTSRNVYSTNDKSKKREFGVNFTCFLGWRDQTKRIGAIPPTIVTYDYSHRDCYIYIVFVCLTYAGDWMNTCADAKLVGIRRCVAYVVNSK